MIEVRIQRNLIVCKLFYEPTNPKILTRLTKILMVKGTQAKLVLARALEGGRGERVIL